MIEVEEMIERMRYAYHLGQLSTYETLHKIAHVSIVIRELIWK